MKSSAALITRILLLLSLCVMLQLPVLSTAWTASAAQESTRPQNTYAFTDNLTTLKYPVMPLSPEQKRAEDALAGRAPAAPIDAQVQQQMDAVDGAGANFSLLPHLNYIPAERNQNPRCGNCVLYKECEWPSKIEYFK